MCFILTGVLTCIYLKGPQGNCHISFSAIFILRSFAIFPTILETLTLDPRKLPLCRLKENKLCYFGKVLLHACCVERLVRCADVTV